MTGDNPAVSNPYVKYGPPAGRIRPLEAAGFSPGGLGDAAAGITVPADTSEPSVVLMVSVGGWRPRPTVFGLQSVEKVR
eukprot:5926322-Prorocentrum_lima.AAC.1